MIKSPPMVRPGSVFFILSFICLVVFTSSAPLKEDLSEDILKHTNQFRKSRGLSPLEMRNDLNAIARKHSQDMASGRRSFGHGGLNERVVKVKKIIIPYHSIAENIAFGASSGKEAVSIWKNSRSHRQNLLGNYQYIGIGTARNRRGVIYYTQLFVK